MSVHIEGMGWMGSVLAYRLRMHGIPFTWNDTEQDHVAWRASTGLVYPAGDRRTLDNLQLWERWYADRFLPEGTVCRSVYAFTQARPPHGGRYPVTDLGWVRAARASCFSVNVAEVVRAARREFADSRTPGPPAGDGRRITAHGFGSRLSKVMWGWSAKVRLGIPDELLAVGARPALYSRPADHPFRMFYAYPCPGEDLWWAGSALVGQHRPRELDAAAHFERWREIFTREVFPSVPVTEAQPPVQGWRPRGTDTDTGRLQYLGGALVFPPLWHSGVRWAPQLINDAVKWSKG